MAGLYDRIIADEDSIKIHFIVAGIKGYGTGIWTKAQVLAQVNGTMDSPLATAEETDFDDIAAALDGQANNTAKLGYVNQVEAAMIAAERELVTDAQWRTALEI